MKVEVKASGDREKLAENLEERVESVRREGDLITVETENPELLSKVPGIESYSYEGKEHPGLKGHPVQEQAYARLETRKDAVTALLATVEGYDLRILDTSREWDLRQLKKYNPDIKHLKFSSPKDFLEIEKATFEAEGLAKIEVEVPEEKVETIYREMLT